MNRKEWLDTMPCGCSWVEVGVQQGLYSREILERAKPSVLYLVDCWRAISKKEGDWIPYKDGHYPKVMMWKALKRFAKQIKRGVVRPINMFSHEAVGEFEDGEVWAVYIDAFHEYEDCYQDLRMWTPKVRVGGVVAGHDYHERGPKGLCGVPRAVNQFVYENGYELNLSDNEDMASHGNRWPTKHWWFRKTHESK